MANINETATTTTTTTSATTTNTAQQHLSALYRLSISVQRLWNQQHQLHGRDQEAVPATAQGTSIAAGYLTSALPQRCRGIHAFKPPFRPPTKEQTDLWLAQKLHVSASSYKHTAQLPGNAAGPTAGAGGGGGGMRQQQMTNQVTFVMDANTGKFIPASVAAASQLHGSSLEDEEEDGLLQTPALLSSMPSQINDSKAPLREGEIEQEEERIEPASPKYDERTFFHTLPRPGRTAGLGGVKGNVNTTGGKQGLNISPPIGASGGADRTPAVKQHADAFELEPVAAALDDEDGHAAGQQQQPHHQQQQQPTVGDGNPNDDDVPLRPASPKYDERGFFFSTAQLGGFLTPPPAQQAKPVVPPTPADMTDVAQPQANAHAAAPAATGPQLPPAGLKVHVPAGSSGNALVTPPPAIAISVDAVSGQPVKPPDNKLLKTPKGV